MLDVNGNDLSDESKVFVVAMSVLSAWVCAPKSLTKEQVQTAVNEQLEPSGTTLGWQVEERSGQSDPRGNSPDYCAECDTRQHWLIVC